MIERRTTRLEFRGALGAALVGRLERPAGEPVAFALFAHCFTCSKDLKAVGGISRTMAGQGYAVFRFDFTGLGESAGDFGETDFSSNLDDLIAAADFLRREFRAPRLLVGHSLGGAAVLAAARRVPECTAVATIAAPSDTEHLRDILVSRAPEIEAAGVAEVRIGGRSFRIRKRLLDDLAEAHVRNNLARLDRALLIMHSPEDSVVDVEHARRLFEGARHPKSFVSLDGADHLLNDERDARFAGEVLAAWARRYALRERHAR
ncbi:MAG: alpha/beta hydrolase [Acidobacteria bacterium]|nr:alpha/beta hydrolase [Acidobacteriota bacterium]